MEKLIQTISQSELEELCRRVRAQTFILLQDVKLAEEMLMKGLVIAVRTHLGYQDPGDGVPDGGANSRSIPYWDEMKRIIHWHNSNTFDWTQVIRDNLLTGIQHSKE